MPGAFQKAGIEVTLSSKCGRRLEPESVCDPLCVQYQDCSCSDQGFPGLRARQGQTGVQHWQGCHVLWPDCVAERKITWVERETNPLLWNLDGGVGTLICDSIP